MKKISISKTFCYLSFLFVLCCCIFYGTRFIKLYLENKKVEISEKNSLVKVIKENNENNEYYRVINGQNYFTDKTENNYLMYSNILWRIIKINDDNSITVIANNAITNLAYGKDLTYENSYIKKWLNTSEEEYSGILEKALNNPSEYLQKTTTCTDILDELSNNLCKKANENSYISLLSVADYLNIGSKESYLANKEYFYLSNSNSENKVWYVTEEGNATLGTGNDIYGIRPVITLKANIDYISGNGTSDNPYTIESTTDMFGSYVKLDDMIWRIYQVNETDVKLMLNDYLKVNNSNLTYIYSKISSYHDDYKSGSIAYYLNHDFLNTLSYKDKIKEVKWSNGYYNATTNYDYKYALDDTIESKVALISIGNIILNPELSNYFTMTGTNTKSSMVYTIQENKKLYAKQISATVNVVPTISIDKELLTKGNGTIDSPYEME